MDFVVYCIGEKIFELFSSSFCLHYARENTCLGRKIVELCLRDKSDCTLVAVKVAGGAKWNPTTTLVFAVG